MQLSVFLFVVMEALIRALLIALALRIGVDFSVMNVCKMSPYLSRSVIHRVAIIINVWPLTDVVALLAGN